MRRWRRRSYDSHRRPRARVDAQGSRHDRGDVAVLQESPPQSIVEGTGTTRGESKEDPADPRRGGLARGDPGPHAGAHPGSRPRDDRGAEMEEAVEWDGR